MSTLNKLVQRIEAIGIELVQLELNRGTTELQKKETRLQMLKLIAERIGLRGELLAMKHKAG